MGEKNNDQSIMDKSMRSVFGKFKYQIFFVYFKLERTSMVQVDNAC